MTFLEMKKRGLELMEETHSDPRVQLVAGLRADRDAPWQVFTWPWPAVDEATMARLDRLYARHAAAIREGAPLPWFVKDSNEAVLYVRAEPPGAQVIPLPATPTPVLMNPAAVAAALCSEARALADACRALAAKLERLAMRLEP